MTVGVLGLGKMGSRIALKLSKSGHRVIAWNRGPKDISGLEISKNIENLISKLPRPKVLWLMLPAGEATQGVLDQLEPYLEKGDIVVDGGNAYFKDTERRFGHFKPMGIEYLGIGISGGILAEGSGYPLMAGGSKEAYEYIIPLLDSLAKPKGGHKFFGEGGAGHFIKMAHNGIEYGMMQSLAEGFEVLEKSDYKFDLVKVAEVFQKGTVISGFLMDRLAESLKNSPDLKMMEGPVSESGEARWTIEEAKNKGINIRIIEDSLRYRLQTQKQKELHRAFSTKVLNALRNAFGGHEIGK